MCTDAIKSEKLALETLTAFTNPSRFPPPFLTSSLKKDKKNADSLSTARQHEARPMLRFVPLFAFVF